MARGVLSSSCRISRLGPDSRSPALLFLQKNVNISYIINDSFFPRSPEKLLTEKQFPTVPYLLGVNNHEFGWLMLEVSVLWYLCSSRPCPDSLLHMVPTAAMLQASRHSHLVSEKAEGEDHSASFHQANAPCVEDPAFAKWSSGKC